MKQASSCITCLFGNLENESLMGRMIIIGGHLATIVENGDLLGETSESSSGSNFEMLWPAKLDPPTTKFRGFWHQKETKRGFLSLHQPISWDMWDFRCDVKHNSLTRHKLQEMQQLDTDVIDEHGEGFNSSLRKDMADSCTAPQALPSLDRKQRCSQLSVCWLGSVTDDMNPDPNVSTQGHPTLELAHRW